MEKENPIFVKAKAVECSPIREAEIRRFKVKILAMVLLAVIILSSVAYNRFKQELSPQNIIQKSQIETDNIDRNNEILSDNSISSVVEKVSPSVVSIVTASSSMSLFGSYEQSGAGTGVILSKDGYILTNKHVVKNTTSLTVITSDGEAYDQVEVVFEDPLNDLAFLKVSGVSDLTPIEIGDSKTVKVGQPVIAIGNSLGQYQNTVTRGIISGTSRSVTAQSSGGNVESLTDMLQTDAAINPGNSGGPLVNAGGQIIGINTAVTQGANGLGFAIPIGAAKGVIKQLGQADKIQRVMLGVRYVAINPAIAKDKNLSEKTGALISDDVVENSSADQAGLKKGDIITKINNDVIGKAGGLGTLLSEYAIGDQIELEVKRGEQTLNLKVTLQAAK